MRMFRDLNLKSKTSFMFLGARFVLTLSILMSNFGKVRSCISKELSFVRSSLKLELRSFYANL